MTDTTVKYFESSMSGAPTLNGTAGSIINVLDACLVNGFGSVTLNSLVVSGNVATGTVNAGHGFSMIGNVVGPVITIADATPVGLNGEWRIASIPNSTTFTFATTGISDQTATGTITAKRSPAGFEKAFSGTNKAVYHINNINSFGNGFLRINDPSATATINTYVSMTDIDTGVDSWGPGYFIKSITSDSVARTWILIADNRAFYFIGSPSASPTERNVILAYGDLSNCSSIDRYATFAVSQANNTTPYLEELDNPSYSILIKNASGTVSNMQARRFSHIKTPSRIATGGMAYPNPNDNSAYIWPIDVWDGNGYRGLMPGIYNPLHNKNIPDKTIITNIPGRPESVLYVLFVYSTYSQIAFEISTSWRA